MNSNWSYSPEMPNLGQNQRFFMPYDLQICQTTLKNNRTPLLCHVKLCVSSYRHMWIQTGVRVLKRVNWILTFVILTFFMDITSGNGNHSWNFMMIRWQKHCQKGVTDRRTGRQTEISVLKDAWSQLKWVGPVKILSIKINPYITWSQNMNMC